MENRYDEIAELLSRPEIGSDPEQLQTLGREKAKLQEPVAALREYRHLEEQIASTREMLDESRGDAEMHALIREEMGALETRKSAVEERLQDILRPKDPNDERDVVVEIRAGTGGEEAGLFAADLFRMYTRYAESKRWKIEVLNTNETGIGGIREGNGILEIVSILPGIIFR